MDKLIIRSIDIKKGTMRKGAKKIRKEEINKREEKMKHKLLRRLALLKKNNSVDSKNESSVPNGKLSIYKSDDYIFLPY